jgi:hypothetical protein
MPENKRQTVALFFFAIPAWTAPYMGRINPVQPPSIAL